MASRKDHDVVTIFVKGARLTPRYVITPPIGMTNGEPKPRWIELQRCKAVSQHSGGVSITAIADVFRSRGIETSGVKAAKFEEAGYDNDFYAWTEEQAGLLRAGEFSRLDIANIAEEIEDMGRSIRRELRNRLAVLTMHLLKWQYQPGHRSRSWAVTIREQREQIAELLDESPSLKPVPARDLTKIYKLAITKALGDTGLPEAMFPTQCPFTPEQILAEDFLPEN